MLTQLVDGKDLIQTTFEHFKHRYFADRKPRFRTYQFISVCDMQNNQGESTVVVLYALNVSDCVNTEILELELFKGINNLLDVIGKGITSNYMQVTFVKLFIL